MTLDIYHNIKYDMYILSNRIILNFMDFKPNTMI